MKLQTDGKIVKFEETTKGSFAVIEVRDSRFPNAFDSIYVKRCDWMSLNEGVEIHIIEDGKFKEE